MNQTVKRSRGRPRKNTIPEPQDSARESSTRELPHDPLPIPVAPLKVHIYPSFGEEDAGDGGVRRVVEGQINHLGKYGIQIVDDAEEADVIACHIKAPPPYFNRFANKPFVAMCHGLYWREYEWENWAKKANAEVMELLRVSEAITAPSEWVANAIRRHTSRPVHIIPHGVEEIKLPPEGNLGYVLWNKTRPDPVCDPEPLDKVAELLPDVKFVTTFGKKAANVEITGKLPYEAALQIINRAGVYLCTSRETFGIGTLEAMLCSVPVVGYRWGGQAEFIEQGVDGWLATPGDIEGLAEGIKWALSNREVVGVAAKRKAESYTWDKAAERYAELFHSVYEKHVAIRPRTSIIVTNYNLHQYLAECLKSVQEQSDKDWECIVVDDASPVFAGREIAREFANKDPRFKLIDNKENVYLAEARNIGIRQAKGKYILPLDADDLLPPDAVARLASALDIDKSIHIAYGNVRFADENLELINYSPQLDKGHSGWPMPFSFEQQIIQRNLLPYSSMYRREAWEYVGGYRRRQRTAEDAEFWTRLASYGFRPKFVTSEDTLIYRVRPNSMSSEQPGTDWTRWYSWARNPKLAPAGVVTREQLGIDSLDPIVISVVIPVGPGHERYVHDAVDSVESQTFQNWECIVVNDTGGKLPELPQWVKVIETSGSTGVAHARNVGIAAAKGRLFLPLDADDYLEPPALEYMFQAYQDTGYMVYSDFWDIAAPGEHKIHQCDDYDPYLVAGKKRILNGQQREGMIHSVVVLTPKVWWEEVGGYDEALPAWEDWDFALSLADKGHCAIRVAAPLFTYRKYTGMRREQNFEFFDKSKEAIIKKWNKLWEGGEQLMACGACNAKKTSYPLSMPQSNGFAAAKLTPNESAVLVRYKGQKAGAMPFRGKSGTTYWFGASDPVKYVLNTDIEGFMRYQDFEIINSVSSENITEPTLVSEGSPQQPAVV